MAIPLPARSLQKPRDQLNLASPTAIQAPTSRCIRAKVAISHSGHAPYTLAGGAAANAGSRAALNAATGKILWQVATPGQDAKNRAVGSLGLGAVSVAAGDLRPHIVDEQVYWGTGYSHFGPGTPGNTLLAFTLP